MYSTSDVDMDNGSFSRQSLSGFGNQNSGILVDNGFSIGSSSTGILNDIEDITTDNGISFDVTSSEPIHLSDEERQLLQILNYMENTNHRMLMLF